VSRIAICLECHGAGVLGFDRGPAVERCARCHGIGLTFADESTGARDFLELLTAPTGPELAQLGEGGAVRALAILTARLEERCERLERELAELR
jgi:hypothetical protein